ncbi:MAG TPA: HNH endonuclease family protein [Acidimicrobiales bacterium]|nr:HNH endonuclease family protein [Acidimicrobiales bacterium]
MARVRVVVAALAAGALLLACGASTKGAPSTTSTAVTKTTTTTAVVVGTALAALDTIPIKGRAPKTGYARSEFGPAWADVDHNGCDTRNDILQRDLRDIAFRPNTHDCVVISGTLEEPYTGQTMQFDKAKAYFIQIDHVVALGDAWQKGAQQLTPEQREAFANDPLELLAVNGSANESKGDGDAATWLPPNKPYRCAYVARQVAVKAKWHLWMTAAEADASRRVLARCPNEPLPR